MLLMSMPSCCVSIWTETMSRQHGACRLCGIERFGSCTGALCGSCSFVRLRRKFVVSTLYTPTSSQECKSIPMLLFCVSTLTLKHPLRMSRTPSHLQVDHSPHCCMFLEALEFLLYGPFFFIISPIFLSLSCPSDFSSCIFENHHSSATKPS